MAERQPLLQIIKPLDLDEIVRNEPLPQKIIRALPIPDLYFALREEREDTRREVLSVALTEQIQGLIDLDIWDRDRMDLRLVREWFHELAASMPPARFAVHVRNLDPEILTALLITEFIIMPIGYDFEMEAPDGDPEWQSPDGRFWLWRRTTAVNPDAEIAGKVLDIVYAHDTEFAQKLLLQACTGLHMEMEEQAFKFRDARLGDMGFPEAAAAASIWQPRKDTASDASQETPEFIAPEAPRPTYLAERMLAKGRLQKALLELEPERQEEAAHELIFLTNAALISEAVQVRDRAAVERTIGMVSGFLELGLDTEQGPVAMRRSLKEVFQLGLGRVAPLSRRARELLRTNVFDRWSHRLTLLEPGDSEFLQSLARPHPTLADPDVPEQGPRGFRTAEDLRRAELLVDELEAAAGFLFGPNGPASQSTKWMEANLFPPREERTVRTLLGTFLARIVLRKEPSVEPIGHQELKKLLASVENLGQIREGLDSLAGADTPLGRWLRRQADQWLEDLKEAGGDPRLVTSVLWG